MNNINKLRQLIREEIKGELKLSEENEVLKGGIIGYLTGALIDFLMKKKAAKGQAIPEKSLEQLEKEMQDRLNQKYASDPKFKEMVDNIKAGTKYKF